ncbi:hypothetical protein AAFF_G00415430 [Aldrovandia affinis]|uniref:Uncharacterized protein n=1 Tax=Aldrovandia affinis TaxID=143900 RepID=A0AAD7WKB1_9TELE|nr:hypothetical protein AAFF_G00415430 [Aldrovandia affinis]
MGSSPRGVWQSVPPARPPACPRFGRESRTAPGVMSRLLPLSRRLTREERPGVCTAKPAADTLRSLCGVKGHGPANFFAITAASCGQRPLFSSGMGIE